MVLLVRPFWFNFCYIEVYEETPTFIYHITFNRVNRIFARI